MGAEEERSGECGEAPRPVVVGASAAAEGSAVAPSAADDADAAAVDPKYLRHAEATGNRPLSMSLALTWREADSNLRWSIILPELLGMGFSWALRCFPLLLSTAQGRLGDFSVPR